MEFLNKVELKGIVGKVQTTEVSQNKVTNFTVITETSNGHWSESMWIFVVAWDNATAQSIGKGDNVHVIGRFRQRRFNAQDGVERTVYEVIATEVNKL